MFFILNKAHNNQNRIHKLTINSALDIYKYLMHHKAIKISIITGLSFGLFFGTSFGLTESVDLFGQTNSADLILNDIWIEPQNPREGEPVTVHGSLYNSGIIPTGDISDAVTIGYVVNGELLEINLLESVLPGLENGVEISSGPLFDASSGEYTVTVIVNFHDTLSHLRDNQENNIVQKKFQIGNKIPTLLTFETLQEYNSKTKNQIVTIQGELINISEKESQNKEITIKWNDNKENVITDANGEFSFSKKISFKDEPIKVDVELQENHSFPTENTTIFPIKLNKDQTALSIKILSMKKEIEKDPLTIVIFQNSYDNLFKKIATNNFDEQSVWSNEIFLTTLPANHEYIIEIYLEGRLLTAFQEFFTANKVVEKEILLPEPVEIRFRVIDELGEPQQNAVVNNWIYSGITNENGFTDWIKVLPTYKEAYIAKITFADENVSWSEPIFIENGERKVIQIVKEESK